MFGCIMKIVVENIFMCLVLFWKCYFPTNFLHFLSIQTNFITKNFKITAKSQSTEQITAKSQHHTPPKLQFNPRQQTPAIKSHNHQNTTTTPPQQQQKSKSHRKHIFAPAKQIFHPSIQKHNFNQNQNKGCVWFP